MCISNAGRIVAIDPADPHTAGVDMGGVIRPVSLALLHLENVEVRSGDWVISAAGLAVRVIDEESAHELLMLRDAPPPAAEDV